MDINDGRCIAVHDIHSPLSRCVNLKKDGYIVCDWHLEMAAKNKSINVLVCDEIRDRIKSDYPHPTIKLGFTKENLKSKRE